MYIYTYMYLLQQPYIRIRCMSKSCCACKYIYIYMFIFVCICTYVYLYICIYAFVCPFIDIHIHIYTYIYSAATIVLTMTQIPSAHVFVKTASDFLFGWRSPIPSRILPGFCKADHGGLYYIIFYIHCRNLALSMLRNLYSRLSLSAPRGPKLSKRSKTIVAGMYIYIYIYMYIYMGVSHFFCWGNS